MAVELIAYCGLYCAECRKYKNGKCPGCAENQKATWCTIRTCCIDSGYKSCAECTIMPLAECKKFNNAIGKVIGFVFNSDRAAGVARIKEVGAAQFAAEMDAAKRMALPRRKKK